jgi:uncharacterized protein (TIGR00369 family)
MKELVRERSFTWSDPRSSWPAFARYRGIEVLRMMQRGEIPPPPFVSAFEFRIESVEEGRVEFSATAQEWMCNPSGVLHGGVAAALADTVLTLCVFTKLPLGRTATTTGLNLHYVRPLLPDGSRFRAVGEAVHIGANVATAEAKVYNAAGKLVAHGTTTLALLDMGPPKGP